MQKKKELPGILLNVDVVKKTNILPIPKFNDLAYRSSFWTRIKNNSELLN